MNIRFALIGSIIYCSSLTHAMNGDKIDADKKDTLHFKHIATISSNIKVDDRRISLHGSTLIGLEKVLLLSKQTEYQFVQKRIGENHATILSHLFKKHLSLSFLETNHLGNNVIFSANNKLFIINMQSGSIEKVRFKTKITAVAIDSDSEYFAVGQENGTLSLVGFEKGRCKLELPKIHTNSITTIQFGKNSFISCDAVGRNYHWKNIWSNRRHYTRMHTRFPVINAKIGSKFIALQHPDNKLDYPKISIFNQKNQKAKTLFGTLIGITENDELFVEQDSTKLFLLTPEGEVLNKYTLPEQSEIIRNKKSNNPIPFLIKQDKEENDLHKSDFSIPIFS